jgi:hypothetical protein
MRNEMNYELGQLMSREGGKRKIAPVLYKMSLHVIFSKFVSKLAFDGVDSERLASAFPFGTGESLSTQKFSLSSRTTHSKARFGSYDGETRRVAFGQKTPEAECIRQTDS